MMSVYNQQANELCKNLYDVCMCIVYLCLSPWFILCTKQLVYSADLNIHRFNIYIYIFICTDLTYSMYSVYIQQTDVLFTYLYDFCVSVFIFTMFTNLSYVNTRVIVGYLVPGLRGRFLSLQRSRSKKWSIQVLGFLYSRS